MRHSLKYSLQKKKIKGQTVLTKVEERENTSPMCNTYFTKGEFTVIKSSDGCYLLR